MLSEIIDADIRSINTEDQKCEMNFEIKRISKISYVFSDK